MENTKITITPLYLSYTHNHPHPHKQQLSVLLKFKRIVQSTGYQLQKFQCKKTFPFPHNNSVNTSNPSILDLRHFKTQTAINFLLVKEMQLSNTKVDIIVIGLLNLGKDVNLLGIASLDLGLFEEVNFQKEQFKRQMNIKLDKCDDPGAFMHVQVCLKQIQQPKRTQNRKQENVEPMGMLETQGFSRESFMLNRRKNRDYPTAYEISHRNYKQVQITRTEQYSISPQTKANEKLQRSYKKRFQYQYEVSMKRIAKNKEPHKVPSNVNKTIGGTQRNSPSPRLRTPEPIKQVSTAKNKLQNDSKSSRKQDTYQNITKNKPTRTKKQSISRSHVTERPVKRQDKRFQYSENEEQKEEDQGSNHFTNSSPSEEHDEQSHQEKDFYTRNNPKVEESPDIEAFNDNKFRKITQKFQRIDQSLMENTPAYKQKIIQPEIKSFNQNGDQISSDNNPHQFSEEEQDQIPRQLVLPLPYHEKSESNQSHPNVYESQVDHYSPQNSSIKEQEVKKKDKVEEGMTIFESETIKIGSPSKQKKSEINQRKIESIKADEKFQSQMEDSQNKSKEGNPDKQQQSPLQKKSATKRDFLEEKDSIKRHAEKKQKEVNDQHEKCDENLLQKKQKNKEETVSKKQKSSESIEENELQEEAEPKTKPNRMAKRKSYQEQNTVEDHRECEQKMSKLEDQLEEKEESFRKLLMEKDLECKKRIKQEQEKVAFDMNEIQRLRENDFKQNNLIEKLNKMYEQSDDKNFELSKDYEKKCMEYQRKVDGLTKKNDSLQTDLKEKDKKIWGYEKKIEELNGQLADVKQKLVAMVKAQNERILQQKQPFSNLQGSERSSKKSEKGQTSNINQASYSEDNFKEGYLNIKKKCVNFQAEIKYKQNEIRFLKIKNDNLLQEKKDLENQIDVIISNNKHQMARQSSISKINLQSQSVTNSFKLENKALKEEISNLQTQVHELNQIFEGLIKMDQLTMKSAMKKQQDRKKHQDEINDVLLFKKYKVLQQKAEAYEEEVRSKQQTIAKIINLVWAYGNRPLMQEIGKLIIGKQSQI